MQLRAGVSGSWACHIRWSLLSIYTLPDSLGAVYRCARNLVLRTSLATRFDASCIAGVGRDRHLGRRSAFPLKAHKGQEMTTNHKRRSSHAVLWV